jgi:hypothetical protein
LERHGLRKGDFDAAPGCAHLTSLGFSFSLTHSRKSLATGSGIGLLLA